MKILANDGISEAGKQLLSDAGFEIIEIKVAQNQLVDFINKELIDILLVRSTTQVTKEIIEKCPTLKLIGRAGVGMDNIDVETAENKGIKVINTPKASSYSVAELVFAHLFGGIRFLYDANRNMPLEGDTRFKELKNSYSQGSELKGKTLGIIGFGQIGKAVAEIAIRLGMKVLAYDLKPIKETITLSFFDGKNLHFEIETISKEEVLSQSDFITLHIPAQKTYVLDTEEFNLLKEGVGIVNTARGGVLNEKALLEALDTGKVAFAGLDVYEKEPSPSLKILMHPNISHTPHIGASTYEAQERISEELAKQIISLLT